ncbi:zinc-binding alcohol dehydrogenase family protein [Streptomyces sp. NPDC088400]|uniref:quinone oxidoreductase family protein n=1 Tax=Streptomyces sp. NPDC088400 TaxID=3365861 RepID=UPI00381F7A0B
MKAVVVDSFDGSGSLSLVDLPDPVPGPGQIQITVRASGVGHTDIASRRGEFARFPEPGFVPGTEAAGVVTATGDGVDDAWLGRRVFAVLPDGGGYAELVTVRTDAALAELPAQVSASEAVALGGNALTALFMLERAQVAAGECVLVRGAGGGVGLMATQVGAYFGAVVTAVTSSAARGERLLGLGASTVLNRSLGEDRAPGEDRARAEGATYDIVIDPVCGPDLARHIGRLRPNGRYVLCGAAGGMPGPDFASGLRGRFYQSPSLLMLSMRSFSPERMRSGLKAIFELAARGALRGVVDEELSLGDASRAHDKLESGAVFGKLVLTPTCL